MLMRRCCHFADVADAADADALFHCRRHAFAASLRY